MRETQEKIWDKKGKKYIMLREEYRKKFNWKSGNKTETAVC